MKTIRSKHRCAYNWSLQKTVSVFFCPCYLFIIYLFDHGLKLFSARFVSSVFLCVYFGVFVMFSCLVSVCGELFHEQNNYFK